MGDWREGDAGSPTRLQRKRARRPQPSLIPPPPHTHLPIHAARADEALSAAAEAGALAFLRTGVLESAPMRDEPDHQRELYASVLNQLLMLLLSSSAGA